MDFSDALNDFLVAQGKTLEDLKGSLGLVPEPNSIPVVGAQGEAQPVLKIIKGSDRSYRRLRLFSGKSPVPSGELDFENWRRLARQLLKDDSVPEREKRSRITESLVPPALNVVWAVADGSSAQEHLDTLARAYGSTADGDELLTSFRCSYQKEEEKASDYLLRLYTLLTQVIEMEGIVHEDADKTLCSQFQRGCLFNDPLLNILQLQTRKNDPPNMLLLLREVRVAESQLDEKTEKRKGSVKATKRASAMAQTATACAPEKTSPSHRENAGEVEELRQVVERLHHRLDGLFKSQNTPRRPAANPRQFTRRAIFCYNCGEDGHRMDSCTNRKNPTLVQEKMTTRMNENRSSGNAGGQL